MLRVVGSVAATVLISLAVIVGISSYHSTPSAVDSASSTALAAKTTKLDFQESSTAETTELGRSRRRRSLESCATKRRRCAPDNSCATKRRRCSTKGMRRRKVTTELDFHQPSTAETSELVLIDGQLAPGIQSGVGYGWDPLNKRTTHPILNVPQTSDDCYDIGCRKFTVPSLEKELEVPNFMSIKPDSAKLETIVHSKLVTDVRSSEESSSMGGGVSGEYNGVSAEASVESSNHKEQSSDLSKKTLLVDKNLQYYELKIKPSTRRLKGKTARTRMEKFSPEFQEALANVLMQAEATPDIPAPAAQKEKWCNGLGNKVLVMTDKAISNYPNKDFCISLCQENNECAWVGFRRRDNYCEFWGAGSCRNPHHQPGHDIYKMATVRSNGGDYKAAWMELFHDYGTYLVNEVSVGGQLRIKLSETSSQSDQLTENALSAAANVAYSGNSASFNYESAKSKAKQEGLKNFKSEIECQGGDIAICNAHGEDSSDTVYAEWSESIVDSPQVFKSNVRPIWDFIPKSGRWMDGDHTDGLLEHAYQFYPDENCKECAGINIAELDDPESQYPGQLGVPCTVIRAEFKKYMKMYFTELAKTCPGYNAAGTIGRKMCSGHGVCGAPRWSLDNIEMTQGNCWCEPGFTGKACDRKLIGTAEIGHAPGEVVFVKRDNKVVRLNACSAHNRKCWNLQQGPGKIPELMSGDGCDVGEIQLPQGTEISVFNFWNNWGKGCGDAWQGGCMGNPNNKGGNDKCWAAPDSYIGQNQVAHYFLSGKISGWWAPHCPHCAAGKGDMLGFYSCDAEAGCIESSFQHNVCAFQIFIKPGYSCPS